MGKKNKDHPRYIEMITEAITHLANRKGSSKIAIVNYIKKTHKVGDNDKSIQQIVKMTLLSNTPGKLKLVKGSSAAGSFKLASKQPAVPKKKSAAPKKKSAAPKKKSAAPKKKSTVPKKKSAAPKKKSAALKVKSPAPKKKAAPKKK